MLFLLILMIAYYILGYYQILFLRPEGIHFIRQTDSLSFVANYYKNGMNFFQPQVFNLQSIDGKAACEFPFLYYLTAIFYKVFGEHEFILRLITVIIVSLGLLSLFKFLSKLLNDVAYALILTFLFLSSTVLLYYTNNFLPDASAFGLTLIGWYYFYRFLQNRSNNKLLILSLIFFTLSSLLKVTYFLYPISAILTLFVFDFNNKVKMKQIIKTNISPIIFFLFSLTIIISWNIYAIHYNKENKDFYFLVSSQPIWNMSKEQIYETWSYITGYWQSRYYSVDTFHFFFAIIIAGFFVVKKSNKLVLTTTVFVTIGSLIYFLLFFAQFKHHDYYFITLIPAIIFIITNSFIALRNKFPKIFNSIIMKLLFLVMSIVSLNYAREKLNLRYENKDDKFSKIGIVLSDAKKQIDSIGIPQNSKFIIYTDKTPNGGLYFINRPGWNIQDTTYANRKNIDKFIKLGADYLLCTENNDTEFIDRHSIILTTDKITIYKIVKHR